MNYRRRFSDHGNGDARVGDCRTNPFRQRRKGCDGQFQHVSLFEIEVTPMTSPALLLEQVPHFWRRLGMGALPLCPVNPVSITWAFSALHLHMSLDWRHAMEVQRPRFGCKAPPSFFRMPVRAGPPRS